MIGTDLEDLSNFFYKENEQQDYVESEVQVSCHAHLPQFERAQLDRRIPGFDIRDWGNTDA